MMKWADVIHIAFLNLQDSTSCKKQDQLGKMFYPLADLNAWIDEHYDRFFLKTRPPFWKTSLTGYMSVSDKFCSGTSLVPKENGLWALSSPTQKFELEVKGKRLAPAYRLGTEGELIEMVPTASAPSRKRPASSSGGGDEENKVKDGTIAPLLISTTKAPRKPTKISRQSSLSDLLPNEAVDVAAAASATNAKSNSDASIPNKKQSTTTIITTNANTKTATTTVNTDVNNTISAPATTTTTTTKKKAKKEKDEALGPEGISKFF